jgi:hypothetical protein
MSPHDAWNEPRCSILGDSARSLDPRRGLAIQSRCW